MPFGTLFNMHVLFFHHTTSTHIDSNVWEDSCVESKVAMSYTTPLIATSQFRFNSLFLLSFPILFLIFPPVSPCFFLTPPLNGFSFFLSLLLTCFSYAPFTAYLFFSILPLSCYFTMPHMHKFSFFFLCPCHVFF